MSGARRPRRWPTVVLGLLCTAIGAGLMLGSLSSVAALTVLVAAGLVLTGLLELAGADRGRPAWLSAAAGVGGLAAGVALAVWPRVPVAGVAVIAGIWLIVDGAVTVFRARARTGDRRLAPALPGMAGVVLGVLVLSRPHVTVFVVAVVLGVHLVLVGVAEAVAASRGAPDRSAAAGDSRRRTRAVAAAAAVVVALPLLAAGVWLHAGQPRPDPFYTPPRSVPAVPGALVRGEPFSRGAPPGARAWRILYTTTRDDHTPAVASAVVLAATRIPSGPRPVLAWAHGATGIARPCAPSLVDDPLGGGAMPGLDQVLGDGWVVVATDYTGLGTPGPHPFLIGQGEARSVLDAVRAARHLTAVALGGRTVVWGHSQGGNAALWTGIIAPTYAPDAGVIGVAALAPGSNLVALAEQWGGGESGAIFAAYLIQAYSDTYPDVHFGTYVRPTAEIQIHELADRCLSASKIYLSGLSSLLLGRSIWATDPAAGAAGVRLRDNTPTGPIPMPLLIAQGEADTTVGPAIQADYIRRRCAGGGQVDYRTYPGRDHVGLIAADSPMIPDLLRWSRDRLDGAPARTTCRA
jgi:uncharacterized membrane protein HdeD (DUF308 family)